MNIWSSWFAYLFVFLCSMLQVEHRSTELRAEEIERRVGSETSSLDEMSVASSTANSDHSAARNDDRLKRYSGESFGRRKVSNFASLQRLCKYVTM